MDKFLNKKYKLVRFDEYYENYLKAIGLNMINRKIAIAMPSSTQLIKLSEIEYAMNTIIPLITHQQKFVLGQEREVSTIDGRNIKNIFTIQGNKLIEQQIEPEREVTVVREYFDEQIIGECIVGDIRCKYWCEVIE